MMALVMKPCVTPAHASPAWTTAGWFRLIPAAASISWVSLTGGGRIREAGEAMGPDAPGERQGSGRLRAGLCRGLVWPAERKQVRARREGAYERRRVGGARRELALEGPGARVRETRDAVGSHAIGERENRPLALGAFGLLESLAPWPETPAVAGGLEPQAAMSIEHAAAAITAGRIGGGERMEWSSWSSWHGVWKLRIERRVVVARTNERASLARATREAGLAEPPSQV